MGNHKDIQEHRARRDGPHDPEPLQALKWQFIDLHSPAQALSYSALVSWSVCMSCYKGTLCPLLYVFFHLLLLLDHSTYFLIWGYTRAIMASPVSLIGPLALGATFKFYSL